VVSTGRDSQKNGLKQSSRMSAIRNDFGLDVKPAQQCGTISNTKNLIDRSDFKACVVDLKVCVVVCSLRLIVECIGHMCRDTDANGSIYIAAQIISKQRPDLKQCERE